MVEPKEQRNQLIIELYNQGLVPSEILKELQRQGFTDIRKLSGVKSRIHDLRQRGLISYRDQRYKTSVSKPTIQQATKPTTQRYEKAMFYLYLG